MILVNKKSIIDLNIPNMCFDILNISIINKQEDLDVQVYRYKYGTRYNVVQMLNLLQDFKYIKFNKIKYTANETYDGFEIINKNFINIPYEVFYKLNNISKNKDYKYIFRFYCYLKLQNESKLACDITTNNTLFEIIRFKGSKIKLFKMYKEVLEKINLWGKNENQVFCEFSKYNNRSLKEKKYIKYNHKKSINSRFIPHKLRIEVLNESAKYDKNTNTYIPSCKFCGANAYQTRLHIDHIIPFSKGGKSIKDNLQVLCEECNMAKSNKYILCINN